MIIKWLHCTFYVSILTSLVIVSVPICTWLQKLPNSKTLTEWLLFILRGQELFFCDGILVWRHASSSSDRNGQEAKAEMMNHGWRNGIYLKLFVHVKVDVRHCTQSTTKWYITLMTNNDYYNFGTHAISLVFLVTAKSSLCSISSASFWRVRWYNLLLLLYIPFLNGRCHITSSCPSIFTFINLRLRKRCLCTRVG